MGTIRMIVPLENRYFPGLIAAVNMETGQELARVPPGETMIIPTEGEIDLGIAWVRLGAPAVRLRFMARPDKTYVLHWPWPRVGAEMTAEEY